LGLERGDHMEKEAKLKNSVSHKTFLIILKFIPHIVAFLYALYNILEFLEIDTTILGHLIHVSVFPWIFLYLTSKIFRYCYVHRLPLYYIASCDIITITDYYIGIPISDISLLNLHIFLISLLIFGYTYFYLKNKKNVKDNKKSIIVDN
jgi:hypothetical protein